MSSDSALWFRTKVEDLASDTKIKSTLVELKTALNNYDSATAIEIANSNNVLPVLFECLDTTDLEQIELLVDVIFLLLRRLEGKQLLVEYETLLHQSLTHALTHVKCAALKLMLELMQKMEALSSNLLMEDVVKCLGCPDRPVAQGAVNLLIKLGSSKEGLSQLLTTPVLDIIKNVMLLNDITRFRVFEVIVAVATQSPAALQMCVASGLLLGLLQELKSNDSLIQLNVLEMMNCLSSVDHGLSYLQDSGVIPYLVDKILKIEEEPLSFILLPGLIEFCGNIYKMRPQQFHQLYPDTLKVLLQSIDTPDPVLLGVVISTVGKIGSTNEGKLILLSQDNQMTYFCNKLGRLLVSQNELAVSSLNVLSVLVCVDNNDAHLTTASHKWFSELGPDGFNNIFKNVQLPFIELRLSALNLLNALASQPWGLALVCSAPGMVEYLLDRNTETTKECKYSKFVIVQTIVQSGTAAASFLTTEKILQLKVFVNEGPYYVHANPEVALEGSA